MTGFEQPADDLGHNLAALPVEVRREFMEADTEIRYELRKSRRSSLEIAACAAGFLAVVVAVAVLMQVLP